MTLFEDVEQSGGKIKPRETTFDWLQRCNRQDVLTRRQWIEGWFGELPCSKQDGIKSRLKKDFNQFQEALFEMQVHSILRRMGYSVEIEPDFPGTNNKIDFLAKDVRTDEPFYIEATVSGLGKSYLDESPNEHDVVEKVRQAFPAPPVNIHLVRKKGTLRKTLGANQVVQPIRELLKAHAVADIEKAYHLYGFAGCPSTKINEGDWRLEVQLTPLVSSKGYVLGLERSGGMDGKQHLADSLYRKAKHWKDADFRGMPFLVAVNTASSEFSWNDIPQTLFDIDPAKDIKSTGTFRESLTCFNGVIVFDKAVLGNEIGVRVQLFRNGDAPIPACLQFLLDEQKMGDLLGIG